MKVAILTTCFNRKNITLLSLETLYKAIVKCNNIEFDVYLVDDDSSDGTYDAVKEKFPDVFLIRGNGNLFWGGGMNLAWKIAIESNIRYDGFLWFNDDSILYENSLLNIFSQNKTFNSPVIISGAFLSSDGQNVTYGGKLRSSSSFIKPNGNSQIIELINGNLTYIPREICERIGLIDKHFRHGLGDYDYGLRTIKEGFQCVLSKEFVGMSNRHDSDIPNCYKRHYSFKKRCHLLYSPLYNPMNELIFYSRHYTLLKAIRFFLVKHLYTLFPRFE